MNSFFHSTNEFFSRFMPLVTRRFFYTLLLVFLGYKLLNVGVPDALLERLLVLRPSQAVLQGHLWQFFTYSLSHQGLFHLLGNVLTLFFFGAMVEQRIGDRAFFWFVVLSGFLAGLAHTMVMFIAGVPSVGLIGFSGAAFAILAACVVWFPNHTVMLYFIIPVPLRVLAAVFGFLMLIGLLTDAKHGLLIAGEVSHLAHITGIVFGVLVAKNAGIVRRMERLRIPYLMRHRPKPVRGRMGMGHPGRHTDPDDLYDDPHWRLDQ